MLFRWKFRRFFDYALRVMKNCDITIRYVPATRETLIQPSRNTAEKADLSVSCSHKLHLFQRIVLIIAMFLYCRDVSVHRRINLTKVLKILWINQLDTENNDAWNINFRFYKLFTVRLIVSTVTKTIPHRLNIFLSFQKKSKNKNLGMNVILYVKIFLFFKAKAAWNIEK